MSDPKVTGFNGLKLAAGTGEPVARGCCVPVVNKDVSHDACWQRSIKQMGARSSSRKGEVQDRVERLNHHEPLGQDGSWRDQHPWAGWHFDINIVTYGYPSSGFESSAPHHNLHLKEYSRKRDAEGGCGRASARNSARATGWPDNEALDESCAGYGTPGPRRRHCAAGPSPANRPTHAVVGGRCRKRQPSEREHARVRL